MHSFVEEMSCQYNKAFLTCNFHYLLHIHEDAKTYDGLESMNAFKFENCLQKLKKQIYKADHVAAQVFNRLMESSCLLNRKKHAKYCIKFGPKIKNSDGFKFYVKTNTFYFSISEPNNVCYIGKSIVKIEKIEKLHNMP